MKADFVKVDVNRIGFTLESIVRELGLPLQKAIETLDNVLKKKLTHGDNFDCAIIELPFVHGVETAITNPLRSNPLWFDAREAWDPSTRVPMSVVGTPRVNRTARRDGKIPITVEYDLRHTEPWLRVSKSSNQAIATGTNQQVTWDTLNQQFPVPSATPLINSGTIYVDVSVTSRIRVREAGRYQVSAQISFTANAAGVRDLWFQKNGVNTEIWGFVAAANAGGVEATSCSSSDTVPMNTSDYLEIFGYQSSGVGLSIISASPSGFESAVSISRLYNDSTPTGMVRGVLWGG